MSHDLHAELLVRGVKLDSRMILPGDPEPAAVYRLAEQRRVLEELRQERRTRSAVAGPRFAVIRRVRRIGARAQ